MSSLRPAGRGSAVTQWPWGRLCVVKFTAVGVGFGCDAMAPGAPLRCPFEVRRAFDGLLRDRAVPSHTHCRAVDMF